MDADAATVRALKTIMALGVGAPAGGFPTLLTDSKSMRTAKRVLRDKLYGATHPRAHERMFEDEAIEELVGNNKMAVKMMAFVLEGVGLAMYNDQASVEPHRVEAFLGVRTLAYEIMGIGLYDYNAITPAALWAVGERLASIVSEL